MKFFQLVTTRLTHSTINDILIPVLAHSNVDWLGGQFVQIAKKLGLPEIIYPSDNRNDLYVIINCGKFSKGNKLRDKNIEVTLEVCDEKGNPIKGAISSGD